MTKRDPTEFESRVYALVSTIPKGRVSTYKALAVDLQCGSCQAIGQALRRNPFAPKVPCHRVVSSNLTIGGFSGHVAGVMIAKKRRLLLSEGVGFDVAGSVLPECLHVFD